MSDYVTPSTNYDEEIELTTGTDIVDGSPNSLVIGELTDDGGGGLDTFNPSDQINSAGTVRITGTGTDINFAGAVVQNTNAFEIRNFVTGELTFNAINWGVIPNWVSFNSSGDTAITNIAGAGNFSFIGGPIGSPAHFSADFAPSAYSGASDDMSFWLDGANVEIEINTNSTGDVETGHFLAQNRDSMAYFNVTGMSHAFVTGDASNFGLMQSSSTPISYLELVDSTGYDGNFSFMGYLSNGNSIAPTMVLTGDGANDLDLIGDGLGDSLSVIAGDSADSVTAGTGFDDNFFNVDLNLGRGADEASLYASGAVNIISGNGGDSIDVWDAFELVGAKLGAGNDYISFNVTHDARVNAGNRNDSVDGTAGNDANIFLGSGDNSASITAGSDAKIRSGNDDDTISVTASTTIDVLARDGNNWVDAFINGGDVFDFGKIVTGTGSDTVDAGGYSYDITTGGGADEVDIADVIDSAIVKLGGGNDWMDVEGRGLLDVDSVNFGGGSDTLTASDLDVLSGTGDFDVVNPGTLEWLSFGEASGDVSFDGVDTGANTAGVMNYLLTDPLTQNYDFSNLVDGASIFMSGGSSTNIDLGLENPGGVLNFQFTATSSHTFADFDLESVGTLNLNTIDAQLIGVPTVVFGEKTTSFTDDSGVLSTVVLTGNTHITMGGVNAPNLSSIDGSAVTGNVDIQLIDVADTINVLTGSGNDIVDGSAADSSLIASTGLGADSVLGGGLDDVIETGGGNDTINAGAENDDIDMGAENDIAIFDEDELDSFDTIDGGLGIDTVEAGSSLGNQVDDFFFNWSNTEVLLLSSGGNNLTLNDIANQNGPDTIVSDGGDDKITLGSGYGRALEVQIQVGSNDDIDASGVTNGTGAVVVTGLVEAFNNDTIKGSGNGDELIMTADGMTA
ncbi:MAG: calcium-binding protein, partial [Pseudomonadota bacterium]